MADDTGNLEQLRSEQARSRRRKANQAVLDQLRRRFFTNMGDIVTAVKRSTDLDLSPSESWSSAAEFADRESWFTVYVPGTDHSFEIRFGGAHFWWPDRDAPDCAIDAPEDLQLQRRALILQRATYISEAEEGKLDKMPRHLVFPFDPNDPRIPLRIKLNESAVTAEGNWKNNKDSFVAYTSWASDRDNRKIVDLIVAALNGEAGSSRSEPWAVGQLEMLQRPPQSDKTSQACFIVTAAFEDADGATVARFRAFRDRKLQRSKLGRGLCRLYARWSPSLARLLRRHPAARRFVRGILSQIAQVLPHD